MATDRHSDLTNLKAFITRSDNEITMILQSLQWNREKLDSNPTMSTCTYDAAHRLSQKKLKEHEEQCWLRIQGYTKEEKLLPEPLNSNAHSIIKLNSKDINMILAKASKADSDIEQVEKGLESLKKGFQQYLGKVWDGPPPLTLERLQATYTVDERRAIYDAVVASDPTSHDISDLALNDVNEVKSDTKRKSRIEILSELRDMRRRRTKYRVAAKTKKYSDVLRDVIKTQMETFTGIRSDHEDIVETAHSQKKLEDDIKRERSVSLERVNKQKCNYENKPSASGRSVYSRDEIKTAKYSFKTKRDMHFDESNRRDKYKERYHNRSDHVGRGHENVDHRRKIYREHDRSRQRDKSYDRDTHDDSKRGNRYYKNNEIERPKYTDDNIKMKELNGSIGYRRHSRKH